MYTDKQRLDFLIAHTQHSEQFSREALDAAMRAAGVPVEMYRHEPAPPLVSRVDCKHGGSGRTPCPECNKEPRQP